MDIIEEYKNQYQWRFWSAVYDSLPSVKEAIIKGRPLIAEFSEQIETEPVGGHGLVYEETQ